MTALEPWHRRLMCTLTALALGAIVLTGCGSSSGSKTTAKAPAAANTIIVKNFAFTPKNLTVKPGATVTVKNQDSVTHTVTAAGKAFDSGDVTSSKTMTFTAPGQPGTYSFICSIHPYMKGTLTVK